jgi:hypothetical protein
MINYHPRAEKDAMPVCACGKVVIATWAKAAKVAVRLTRKYSRIIRPYYCRRCGRFHTGGGKTPETERKHDDRNTETHRPSVR